MLITNAQLVLEDKVIQGDLRVEGKLISKISTQKLAPKAGEEIINAKGNFVMPGIVELHSHGAGGYDFMDGEVNDIIEASHMLASHGATTALPTTLTSSDEDLFLFFENFKTAQKASTDKVIAKMPGCHLEGPYFDMVEKGAQDPRFIKTPNKAHYGKIMEAAEGTIKRWSVAPELPGALEMIDLLVEEGILVSGAHTAATYQDISKAFDRGLKLLTHFYSGMSTLTRHGGFRVLGAIESGYLIDELYVEIIADGMHLPPELLALIFKCKRHDRITACSDSMRGAGMGEGPSILGPKKDGTDVIIEDGIAKMPDRTCFAGSVATGDRLARTLAKIVGLSMPEVTKIVSLQPAKLIGMEHEIGSLSEGKQADLFICDEDINIKQVYVDGMLV